MCGRMRGQVRGYWVELLQELLCLFNWVPINHNIVHDLAVYRADSSVAVHAFAEPRARSSTVLVCAMYVNALLNSSLICARCVCAISRTGIVYVCVCVMRAYLGALYDRAGAGSNACPTRDRTCLCGVCACL